MKFIDQEPTRWSDTDLDRQGRPLAALLKEARAQPVPRSSVAFGAFSPTPVRAARRGTRWLLVAAAMFCLIGTAGVVAGSGVLHRLFGEKVEVAPRPFQPAPRPARKAARKVAAIEPPAEAPVDPPALRKVRAPTPLVATSDPTPLVQPPPPAPSEGRILSDAYRLLRVERDPRAALDRLVGFDREFPDAQLQVEARLARVEALISLGRIGPAMQALHGLAPTTPHLARLVLITRGELQAKSGDCAAAASAFDEVIAAQMMDEFDGRALYGRAACLARGGDVPKARDALERYLERHPQGVFAVRARDELGKSATPKL